MPNSYCEEQLMKEGITEPHPNLMCVLPVISSSVIFEKVNTLTSYANFALLKKKLWNYYKSIFVQTILYEA